MNLDLLLSGPRAPDTALAVLRAGVGLFYAIAGAHKLIRPAYRESLRQTFTTDHIPFVGFNLWFVPLVECACGTMLTLGLATIFSALMLGAVTFTAEAVDGWRRMMDKYHPATCWDILDDCLYTPEVLLGLMLAAVLLAGPGAYSLDALLLGRV